MEGDINRGRLCPQANNVLRFRALRGSEGMRRCYSAASVGSAVATQGV